MAATSCGLHRRFNPSYASTPWDSSLTNQSRSKAASPLKPLLNWSNNLYNHNRAPCAASSSNNSFRDMREGALGPCNCRGCSFQKHCLSSRFQGSKDVRGRETLGLTPLHLFRERSWISPRAGINIDRRMHLEEAFKRQQEEEARWAEAEVTCPLDCVREVRSIAEFDKVLREAEQNNELVVMDFYNSACGSCKYVGRQFVKLCKSEACAVDGGMGGVVFVKHNVRDDYDDLTDMARLYSIKVVPMFSFFMDGSRIEQFPTRDRKRLEETLARLLAR